MSASPSSPERLAEILREILSLSGQKDLSEELEAGTDKARIDMQGEPAPESEDQKAGGNAEAEKRKSESEL